MNIQELQNQFEHIRCVAAQAAKRTSGIAQYSPFAELRDAMTKAVAALDEIEAMPAELRERLLGKEAASAV